MSIESLASEPVYRLLLRPDDPGGGPDRLYRLVNNLHPEARPRARAPGWSACAPVCRCCCTSPRPPARPARPSSARPSSGCKSASASAWRWSKIDASSQPDLASQWGVLSVPTTFVIDAQGNPRYVNHGVAPLDKLQRQFAEIIHDDL